MEAHAAKWYRFGDIADAIRDRGVFELCAGVAVVFLPVGEKSRTRPVPLDYQPVIPIRAIWVEKANSSSPRVSYATASSTVDSPPDRPHFSKARGSEESGQLARGSWGGASFVVRSRSKVASCGSANVLEAGRRCQKKE